MRLNQNRTIRLYLLSITLIAGGVFLVFFLANFLVAYQNTIHFQIMQEREFPIIEELIEIERETEKVRALLTNAIAFESEFLIQESSEEAARIEQRLQRIDELNQGHTAQIDSLRDALFRYITQAQKLAEKLIDNTENITQTTDAAKKTNEIFSQLQHITTHYQKQRQNNYAKQLNAINDNIRQTNYAAASIGLILVVVLIIFTLYITRKILQAVTQADTLKESFLTTISHELLTPINGIKGAIDLLSNTHTNSTQKELIGIAYTSAHTMTKTVNDIILFSELMSGDPTMMLSRFNLRSAIETLLASVQNKCNEKSIALHTTFTIPRSEIVCDERKLIRAISHLLDNAIKYSDQGTVSLNVSAAPSPDAPHQSQLYIRIEDEGPGIDDSLFENLFLPFAQGNSAWNRKFQGIGLGLAMSHMIMSSLGGTLSVSNRQNASGVIALATVPCTFIEKDTSKIENDALMADTESTQAPPRYALIVEDNITNQIILKKLLENIGLITSIAQNGEEAIKQVRENYYDIVFMDCQMPVMDGFEATKAIRQLQTQNKRTPIIAITANTRDADKAKCLEVGMDDFLEKPINLPHIELTVNKYLQHRSSQGPTPTNSAYTTNS